MITLALAMFAYVRALFVSRHKLALEAVALRQQLAVFKRKQSRPKLRRLDRLFWVSLRSLWPCWTESLVIVKPHSSSVPNGVRVPKQTTRAVSITELHRSKTCE